MNLLTWCNKRADTYIHVVKIMYKSEETDTIVFKGCIYSTSGYLMEKKNYKMSLTNYRRLERYEGGFSLGIQ
jgi:hypothetical protein